MRCTILTSDWVHWTWKNSRYTVSKIVLHTLPWELTRMALPLKWVVFVQNITMRSLRSVCYAMYYCSENTVQHSCSFARVMPWQTSLATEAKEKVAKPLQMNVNKKQLQQQLYSARDWQCPTERSDGHHFHHETWKKWELYGCLHDTLMKWVNQLIVCEMHNYDYILCFCLV